MTERAPPDAARKNKLAMMLTMAKQNREFDGARLAVARSPDRTGISKTAVEEKKSCSVLRRIGHQTQQASVQVEASAGAGKISNYSICGQVGQGAYAAVKAAVHKATGQKVAIKVYEKYKIADSQRKTCVNREIRVLQRLTHKNIVQLYETIDTPRQLFLVMEMVKGSSLYSYVRSRPGRKLDQQECMRLFSQVVAGIEYCHKHNVVHRDIKLENLLLDEHHNVKIIDFGFSIFAAADQRLKIFCGTPSYMAPEIVSKKEYFGQPADMWSLGILLYTMLCGTFPFRGAGERELFRAIARCQFTYPPTVSAEARDIIGKMLRLDPQKRAAAGEV